MKNLGAQIVEILIVNAAKAAKAIVALVVPWLLAFVGVTDPDTTAAVAQSVALALLVWVVPNYTEKV